ncbi:MAG: right-handed parallel beta-helix repeat-containing protein, partial [Methanomassiliicoccales archaeon]|nr:right-handed parallel beta-helix repeat-containing protein [Methanomassiliicoccales archaeon]
NEIYYDGEITVRSGGALYLDSLDCFQVRGSSVDGTATLLVEEGGMLWMLNTNVVSDMGDDIFDPMSALTGPVSSYYEFIVYGVLQATECSILHAESIYLGPTSDAELVGCLIADYERSGVNVDGCSPAISECIIIGDSMGEPGAEGIVIEGENAYPQITGCLIIANRHGIYARNTDLGAVYDNIFLLNLQAGIYGEAVEGRIHDNVFMLNKVEILLTDSNVTISDNQIGWAKMIDDLAQYAPFIELVGHHLFGIMESSEDLVGTEGDLLDTGLFGLDVTDMLMGHVGVMAMGCERIVMTDNWYGMLYQAVYVMDCPELIFGDRIAPSNLTIPYYVGLNSSTMTVPIQCIEGLYAVRCDVSLVNAYIEVLDDAVVAQDCTGSVINSVLKGGDKNLLVVPSAPSAGAEGGSFEVRTVLKVHAEEDDGDKVTEAKVLVLNALGAMVAQGETDLNGDFVCTVVSYVVTANGKDSSMNPYQVSVEFDNGNVSKEVTAVDPVDGTWETSTTITADADNTWIFAGICVLAIVIILIVVALIMRKKKA